MGLKEKGRRRASPNAVLEAFYRRHQKRPRESELNELAKQCDLQPQELKRWFRSRINQDQPSLTQKFCEVSWKSTFYVISCIMCLIVLHDVWKPLPIILRTFGSIPWVKSWFWDHRECWTGYLQQPLIPSIAFYYIMQLSFYWSLVINLPFEVNGKDFKELVIHHAAAIFLIIYSYCSNYLRIGTLVMIIHDASDCFLELAKVFSYLKWRWSCDTLFIAFAISFLFTRLVLFPFKVLYNTYYYFMELYQPFFSYYFMNALLMALYLVQLFWCYLVIQKVYKVLAHGTIKKGMRSDSEDSEDDENETS